MASTRIRPRRALASALLAFGRDAFNAGFIAEGIETEAEFETLRSLGCPFGQGFYLGRPGTLRAQPPRHAAAGQLWLDEEDGALTPPVAGDAVAASEAATGPDSEVPADPALLPDPAVPADPALLADPPGTADSQRTEPGVRRRRLRHRSKVVDTGQVGSDSG